MIRKTIEYIRIPKKLFFTSLGVLVVVAIALSMKPESTPVDVGVVTIGTFKKSVIEEGVTAYLTKQVLTAPADGITPTLDIKAGDQVKKGQVLVTMEFDTYFKIKSPFDGYVLRVFEKDRRHVPRGAPILEVGNPEKLEIISKVLTEEVVDVRVGQKAIITKWGKDEPLEAIIKTIEPSAEEEISALGVKEQRVGVHLEITTDKEVWKSLGDGFRVEVQIITKEVENAKLVPIGALVANETSTAVFTVEGKKAKLVNVEVQDRNREFAIIDSSIPEGAQVITYPGPSLEDGSKIVIR